MKTLVKFLKSFLLNLLIFAGNAVSQHNTWTNIDTNMSGFPTFDKAISMIAIGDYSYVTGVKSEANGNAVIVTELFDLNGTVVSSARSLIMKQTVPFTNTPTRIIKSSTGHIYVAGVEYLNDFWGYEGVLIKYDAYLNEQWRIYTYLSPDYSDEIKDLAIDSSGNIVLCGLTRGTSDKTTVFINKYNEGGDLIYAYKPASDQERLTDVCKLLIGAKGDIYAGGTSISRHKARRMYALKLNTAGNLEWLKFVDASADALDDMAHSMCFDRNGNICLAGTSEQMPGVWKSFIAKLDQTGKLITKNSFGTQSTGKEGIWKILSANDSCLFALSYFSNSTTGKPKFIIYKLSPLCQTKIINTKEGVIVDAVISRSGCLWITGNDATDNGFITKLCPVSTKSLFNYTTHKEPLLKSKSASIAYLTLTEGTHNAIYACGYFEKFLSNGGYNSSWLVEKIDEEVAKSKQELGLLFRPK